MKFYILVAAIFLGTLFYGCGDTDKNEGDDEKSDSDTVLADDHPQTDGDTDSEDGDDDSTTSLLLPGPYGTKYGETAADFTLPTTKGDWIFSERRSPDDGYIFIIKNSFISSSLYLWASDIFVMMEKAPRNMQIFFISDKKDDALKKDIEALEARIAEALEYTNDPSTWRKNIHIVTQPIGATESWIDEWYSTTKSSFMGIDRVQKIRKGASFHTSRSSSYDPQLSFAAQEVSLYNYEYNLQQKIDETPDFINLLGIDKESFNEEGWAKEIFFSITFPKNGTADTFNQLQLVLTQQCDDPKSCEWDRILNLYLCEKEKEKCTTEVARWITSYGRGGKWLTDITPQLPLFKEGGTFHFRFATAGDQYVNTLQFRMGNIKESPTPTEIIPLYAGTEQFNENYNRYWKKLGNVKSEGDDKCTLTSEGDGSTHIICPDGTDVVIGETPSEGEPKLLESDHILDGLTGNLGDYNLIISAAAENAEIDGDIRTLAPRFPTVIVPIPSDAKKVELATIITGHGNGSEEKNCAEFCPFKTIFTIDGKEVTIEHEEASSSLGCFTQVEDGTLPNQYGSWPFGRAGWCPGKHVEIQRNDITALVTPGKSATINVKALLNGVDYRPVVTSGGYRAEIPMVANIVIYK
ncbi:hypothetical protein KAH37_02815 [bacterium]|nr:hypothetical protein [bacterium]